MGLSERVKKLRQGSVLQSEDGFVAPVDCGAMISQDRFSEFERLINEAVQEGAHLEIGGTQWKHPYIEGGCYFSPTIIGDVQHGMEIAQKERKYLSMSHGIFSLILFWILRSLRPSRANHEI